MMNLASVTECTACGACASVCPNGCIQMKIGDDGFFYPQVNSTDCVDCGLCSKNCHVLTSIDMPCRDKYYYYGWDCSSIKRFEGSSGGAFGALAENIIAVGGIVYGAALSDDQKYLSHKSSLDVSLDKIKKSKYLESDINLTIRLIKNNLRQGKQVLFCGTPCQVYGLRRVFGFRNDKLLLCDFLCHGVPSQVRYQQYLRELELKFGAPIKEVGFRTKKYGWKTYCLVVKFENGREYVKLANEDPYYKHFFSNINLRPSCYFCNRASASHADITLGDFWGARKSGYYDDDKGISLIVCNTDKGKVAVDALKSFKLQPIKPSEAEYAFVKRRENIKRTPLHESFFDDFSINIKETLVCAILKNKFLRTLIYRIK